MVILLTSCAFIQNIRMLSLVKIVQLRPWSLWCIIMQLMGNILWLIMEGFDSCLGEHPLLFSDFKLVKQDEFFADHHRANFRERESVEHKIWVCVLGFYIHSYEVFSHGVATP